MDQSYVTLRYSMLIRGNAATSAAIQGRK